MAKLEITGKVFRVGDTIAVPSKNGTTFDKRELILDTTRFDPYTGERSQYENFPKFEFRKEKCKLLDTIKDGDVVTVYFDINGGFYTNRDGQQSHMNRVDAYDIVVKQASTSIPMTQQQPQQMAQPTAQPAMPNQPMPQYGSVPQFPQNAVPQYPVQGCYPQQGGYQPASPNPNDPPF